MINETQKEIWKNIDGFTEYWVSSRGQIKSRKRGYDHILKPEKDLHGYLLVGLYKDSKRFVKRVHRLVLEAFVGKCPKDHETNHKNGIKDDNNLTNLEWVTQSENAIHAYATGLINVCRMGENVPGAKLKNGEVWLIKRLLWFSLPITKIAKMFKMSRCAIGDINARITWSHIEFEPTEKDKEILACRK